MGIIVDTGFAVGADAENLPVSNSGWSTASVIPPFGNIHLRVTNNGGVNSAYNGTDGGHTWLYYRNEVPADKNQTVTLRIRRRSSGAATYWHAIARLNGGDYICATFSGDANQPVQLKKRVGGTDTTLGTSNDSSRLGADGSEGDLTLEVTGNAPTISARVLWNGVEVIAPVTITDAVLDTVGRVGMAQRSFTRDFPTTAYHLVRFTATDGSTPDTTPPTLTSPAGSQTGSTTASGAVSTNEANGTLYRLVSTNASESAATVKAAALTQAVTVTGLQSVSFAGLTPSTTYYAHYVHRDAAGNDSLVASSASFTTAAAGDVTPPTLSAPAATATGGTMATGSVTTNEANGTLYRYASTNASESAATIKAAGLTQTVSATGAQAVSFTGLTPGVTYYAHYVHSDNAGNDSAVSSSASFVTPAPTATLTSEPLKNNTGTVLASTTIPKVAVLRLSDMTLVLSLTSQSTNGTGVLGITSASMVSGTGYVGLLANADGTSLGAFFAVAA